MDFLKNPIWYQKDSIKRCKLRNCFIQFGKINFHFWEYLNSYFKPYFFIHKKLSFLLIFFIFLLKTNKNCIKTNTFLFFPNFGELG